MVVSDGGFSKLRKYVLGNEGPFSTTSASNMFQTEPEYAGYVVWRGGVPVSKIPKHVAVQIREGVYKNGIYDTILLKQAKDNGEDLWTMGTFIETLEKDVEKYWNKATDGTSRHGTNSDDSSLSPKQMPDCLSDHFREHFAHIPGLVELVCIVSLTVTNSTSWRCLQACFGWPY